MLYAYSFVGKDKVISGPPLVKICTLNFEDNLKLLSSIRQGEAINSSCPVKA